MEQTPLICFVLFCFLFFWGGGWGFGGGDWFGVKTRLGQPPKETLATELVDNWNMIRISLSRDVYFQLLFLVFPLGLCLSLLHTHLSLIHVSTETDEVLYLIFSRLAFMPANEIGIRISNIQRITNIR